MSYQSNNNILAADLNQLCGGVSVTSPFASDAAATNKISAIYGVGYGSRGYGQSLIALPIVSAGQSILSSHWLSLRNAMSVCCQQSETSQTTLPPASFFNSGSKIEAADGAGITYNLPALAAQIDANRLTAPAFGTTLSSNVLTMTRSSAWSSNIVGTARATFSSSDKARYFFNSGGQIRFTFYQPDTSTPQSLDWSNIFSNIGTITFSANQTIRSGTLGTGNFGYYGLSTISQTMFSALNAGSGAYTANDVTISALYQGSNVNGARGNVIDFSLLLEDQHTNAFFDSVASGTNVKVDILTSTTYLTGIESPTMSIVSNW